MGRRLGPVHGHLEQPGAALAVRRERRALPEEARLRRHRHGLGVPRYPWQSARGQVPLHCPAQGEGVVSREASLPVNVYFYLNAKLRYVLGEASVSQANLCAMITL